MATAVGEEGTWNSTYSSCSSLEVERGDSDLVFTVGGEVDEIGVVASAASSVGPVVGGEAGENLAAEAEWRGIQEAVIDKP